MENSSAGQFTRIICIDTSRMKRETEEHYIKELVKVSPNIKHVTGDLRNYISLLTLATSASIYWRGIKELPYPFSSIRQDNYLNYYNILFSYFRHSLTHMYLPRENLFNPIVKGLCQRLPEFTKLTHLTANDTSLLWPLMDYDGILQLCYNLIYLKITSFFRDRVPPPTSYILSLQPLENIRTLHVCFPYPKPTAEYIMHKFPNVQNLILEFGHCPSSDPRRTWENYYASIDDRHPHNITSFTLNFEFKSSESTSWVEHIFTTCTQMKALHYLASAYFRSPSQAAIDANVPLNSTLEALTLKVRTIERGSLATYLRLLPSVRDVTINSASSSMDEVKSKVDMLLDSFNDMRLNTGSPQIHYRSVVDVFGKKALLEIYDGLSDKTRYFIDIEHENGARRE